MQHIEICFLSMLFLLTNASAQEVIIDHIKSDPRYYYAEGSGVTLEEANKVAMFQIASQISDAVVGTYNRNHKTEKSNNGSNFEYTQEINISSFSYAYLQNVEMRVLSPEPDARVFRWVAKSEVKRMLEARNQKIIDFVNTGKYAESDLQIDDALRNYYWALMLAKVQNSSVCCNFNAEKKDCLSFLPYKIKSVLSHINAQIEECTFADNRYHVNMKFTFDGKNVSSLQIYYFDGQSYAGPVSVRDGFAELDLLSIPSDNRIKIRYEYMFVSQASHLDIELKTIFSSKVERARIENAAVEIPIKVNVKKNTIGAARQYKEGIRTEMPGGIAPIASEPANFKQRMVMDTTVDSKLYLPTLSIVERAIEHRKPEEAYYCFTPEGYALFKKLFTSAGTVSLVQGKRHYDFIRANGQILGRFCRIKIKHRNGTTFMENLTFRFNENEHKIESLAFALTQKAENDIFNAASSWTDVSRFTILRFMEDYQTAYSLKRLDYIESVFSEDAIIITGTVFKPATKAQIEGLPLNLGKQNVQFVRKNKQQYIAKLKQQMEAREYLHLTFEDNQTKTINAPRIRKGTVFAIQINQIYDSPVYSDKGYLTLILDTSTKLPIIHVRLWQPEKKDMLSLDEFINKLEF